MTTNKISIKFFMFYLIKFNQLLIIYRFKYRYLMVSVFQWIQLIIHLPFRPEPIQQNFLMVRIFLGILPLFFRLMEDVLLIVSIGKTGNP